MNLSIRPDVSTRVDYQTRQASLANKPEERVEAGQKADKDTLSLSKDNAVDDRSFVAALSKATAESLKVGASDKKVAELHQQVQSGTYRPNAHRIAEKMLGYKD